MTNSRYKLMARIRNKRSSSVSSFLVFPGQGASPSRLANCLGGYVCIAYRTQFKRTGDIKLIINTQCFETSFTGDPDSGKISLVLIKAAATHISALIATESVVTPTTASTVTRVKWSYELLRRRDGNVPQHQASVCEWGPQCLRPSFIGKRNNSLIG